MLSFAPIKESSYQGMTQIDESVETKQAITPPLV